MLNYAEHFTNPARICVVYVYGALNTLTVQKHLDQKCGHILLLAASDISAEDIKTLDEYDKWLAVLKKQGMLKVIKKGTPKSKYRTTIVGTEYGREPDEKWFKAYNCPEWERGYQIYTAGMDLISRYKKAIDHINTAQLGSLDVQATFSAAEHISGDPAQHIKELHNIIKRVYPYGVEADTENEEAVKLLKINRLVSAAFEDKISSDVEKLNINLEQTTEQLCFWNSVTVGASQCLAFLENNCLQAIESKGCISISELWVKFTKPPYGAYTCNWYCYLFALAVRKYNSPEYFYGIELYARRINNDLQNIDFKAPYGFIFLQNAKQDEFRQLFAKLFDIERPDDTTLLTVGKATHWVKQNIIWTPLDCIDHRFYEIFADSRFQNNTNRNFWYEFGYEENFLPWLKENFTDLYIRIRHLDENFRNALTEKYGQQKAELYFKNHTFQGSAVGWLHTKEMLQEGVERYMNSVICYECSKVISFPNQPTYAVTYQAHDEDTDEYLDFKVKDVIGINKKLLGRCRTDFLCIPCLAEYLETSEAELWRMAHDFKEQGCELFS